MKLNLNAWLLAIFTAATLAMGARAAAEQFPTRPLRLVVP